MADLLKIDNDGTHESRSLETDDRVSRVLSQIKAEELKAACETSKTVEQVRESLSRAVARIHSGQEDLGKGFGQKTDCARLYTGGDHLHNGVIEILAEQLNATEYPDQAQTIRHTDATNKLTHTTHIYPLQDGGQIVTPNGTWRPGIGKTYETKGDRIPVTAAPSLSLMYMKSK